MNDGPLVCLHITVYMCMYMYGLIGKPISTCASAMYKHVYMYMYGQACIHVHLSTTWMGLLFLTFTFVHVVYSD